MEWFWKAYVPVNTDLSDLRLSPLLAKDFKGLPPAFVLHRRLRPVTRRRPRLCRSVDRCRRVKTTYVNYPGTIHGFFSLTRFLKRPGPEGQRRSRRGDGRPLRRVG